MGKDCPVCPKRGKIHSLLTFAASSLGWFRIYSSSCFFSVVSTWCPLCPNFWLWCQNCSYVKRRFLPLRSPAINFTGYSGGISGNIWIWRNSSGFPLLFRDMRFPNPLTPFVSFFICFFLGIMPFSTPLSFIFLFLFCPSFSAGFPNPLIPFACGKRTESLSGRTWLLYLFVYCFSFGCLFFL